MFNYCPESMCLAATFIHLPTKSCLSKMLEGATCIFDVITLEQDFSLDGSEFCQILCLIDSHELVIFRFPLDQPSHIVDPSEEQSSLIDDQEEVQPLNFMFEKCLNIEPSKLQDACFLVQVDSKTVLILNESKDGVSTLSLKKEKLV